jgi:hypothetical protein
LTISAEFVDCESGPFSARKSQRLLAFRAVMFDAIAKDVVRVKPKTG